MQEIQLKDAKATFSTMVDDAVAGERFIVTRHGRKEVVVISFKEWERLSSVPSFGRLLMSSALEDGDIPQRSKTLLRKVDL